MADLITRLKVDSTEYDAKIKRAAQGLQHYVQSAHDSGDVIGRLLGDTKKYVESLGNMSTVSSTARGRLAELTAAFTDLRSVYNSLSEEEKSAKGGFGQELNKQLEILKGRINDTKNELKGIDQELGNTKQAEDGAKGGLEGLTSALGINVKSLAGWGAALTAGKVALDVAKDAFFASEANVDEWGRTVQSAQSVYEGFLISINNGDSAQQTENERIRSMIQTGRYIAPIDGRRNAVFNGREMQNGDKLTAGQIRALEKQLQNGMQNVVKLVGNEVKQTGKAIDAYYNSIAKQNGISLQEFKKGTSTWEEFSKKMQGYEQYKEWDKQARTEFAKQGGRGNVDFDKNNPFAEFRKWGTFRVDKMGENSYNDLVRLIQQRDQQAGQAYSMQSQAYRTMNRAEGFTVSKLMGNGGKTIKEEKDDFEEVNGLINMATERVNDLQKRIREAPTENMITELRDQLKDAQAELDRLTGKAKSDGAPTFTMAQLEGMSFDNQIPTIRGNNGRAQDKLNLATAAFATGGTSDKDISNYISGIKNALSNANLGDELYTSMTEKLKDATTVSTLLQEMMERGLAGADLETTAQALKEKLLSPEGIDQTAIQSFLDELNKQIEEAGGVGLKLNADTGEVTDDKGNGKDDGEDLKKFNEGIGKLTGGLSSVTSGLKAVGVDIPKEVDQVVGVINGVSQVISGIGTLISLFGAGAMTANTTAVSLNTAAIGGLIAALEFNTASKFIPFFANGGIVPHAANGYFVGGNSFSGDNTPIMANAGELVLSKSQQGVLASMLTDEERGGGNAQPYLDGEKIYLGLQAYMRRSGLGEIVTSER